jgi:deoxyribonuclease-4
MLKSIEKMKLLGAKKIIFHPGSLTKQSREEALDNVKKNLKIFVDMLKQNGVNDIYLCPETMGKHGQV